MFDRNMLQLVAEVGQTCQSIVHLEMDMRELTQFPSQPGVFLVQLGSNPT